jgi:hypothetical protein
MGVSHPLASPFIKKGRKNEPDLEETNKKTNVGDKTSLDQMPLHCAPVHQDHSQKGYWTLLLWNVIWFALLRKTHWPPYCENKRSILFFFFFLQFWGLISGLHLEPLHQPNFWWWGFLRQGLMNYLPGLALNCDPPDLCLLSRWDNRCEPPVPG